MIFMILLSYIRKNKKIGKDISLPYSNICVFMVCLTSAEACRLAFIDFDTTGLSPENCHESLNESR